MLAPIRIDSVDGFRVVRDDLLPGGSKRRLLEGVIKHGIEYVYASAAFGYAQVALAYACRDVGGSATVFVAKRSVLHPLTMAAQSAGAKIVEVENGYLTVVSKRAKDYCEQGFFSSASRVLLPFGFGSEEMLEKLSVLARALPIEPLEVWCVAGSGTLARGLQRAWPSARHCVVRVGSRTSDVGRAEVWIAPEQFDKPSRKPPPFPSCSNYDAKAWQFIKEHASPGALFWNVGA